MKTLRTVSAIIVVIAMTAVMAIGTFAAGYDWDILNADFTSANDLKKFAVEAEAYKNFVTVKDGALHITKDASVGTGNGANDIMAVFYLENAVTSGKLVYSARIRTKVTSSLFIGFFDSANNLKINCVVGSSAQGGVIGIKSSGNNKISDNAFNDGEWHDVEIVFDIANDKLIFTVDDETKTQTITENFQSSGDTFSDIKRITLNLRGGNPADDTSYIDADYIRISSGAEAGNNKPGTPDTSDATVIAATVLAAGAVVTAFAVKKHRK